MRSLHLPIRLVFAGNTLLYGICSSLLLASPSGPRGVPSVTWAIVVLLLQAVAITAILTAPVPTTSRAAQSYFVGFAIFGDVGLTSVLILYAPVVSAFGCALFVLNSALCTYFVSSRWLLAHMTWSAAVIGWTTWRVHDEGAFDVFATVAGGLVMLAAVCAVPVAAHVAWTLLSIDARQSLRDPLTGLHNRRGIDASLGPLWRGAQVADTAIGAVVIDIDNFKRINDTYGHDVGDLVLQQMSARMIWLAGPAAVVGRTGGEEFTIVLSGTVGEVVERVTSLPDRLRDAIDSAPVTVSVGAASMSRCGTRCGPPTRACTTPSAAAAAVRSSARSEARSDQLGWNRGGFWVRSTAPERYSLDGSVTGAGLRLDRYVACHGTDPETVISLSSEYDA